MEHRTVCGLSSVTSHVIFLFFLWSCLTIMIVHGQSSSISTSMPVPPLQWLNITGLTSGSAIPQPLKDSSMGYDEATRSLIIFGGQSQVGLPQQASYILNMDSLTWSIPATKVASMTANPPPRSQALGTGDFAANSRREFVIFGGMGTQNDPLHDVWAYDYLNEFWVAVNASGGPSARWGTLGGIDPTDTPNSGNNVSNNFTIAGGSDMESNFPLSEIWELSITGTLASDLDTVQGVWRNVSLSSQVPGKSDAGGALVPKTQARPARIVASGGCQQNSSPLSPNLSCVDSSTVVLTVNPGSSTSINQCPAPRLGPVMVPNLNSASASFASQAFLLLGTFNDSMWNDGGGLNKGEVAVLDVDAGVWARILPTGDPTSPNMFPEPRVGAAALAFNTALVGPNRSSASDIIIFGGQDSTGRYLNDLWVLRAYNSVITQSGQKWPGFENDNVGSGIAATGTGVIVNYLTQCAQNLTTIPSTSTSAPTTSSSGQNSQPTNGQKAASSREFDTSVVHKILSPVSLAIAYVPIVLIRLSLPAVNTGSSSTVHRTSILYLGIIIGIAAYAVGVVGFIIALTTTKSVTSGEGSFLRTTHGRGGFVLFILLYAVVPFLFIIPWIGARVNHGFLYSSPQDSSNKLSQDSGAVLGEKLGVNETRRAPSPAQSAPETQSVETPPPSRRQRTMSGPGLFPRWPGRQSSESVSPPVSKGFEVVNRPRRSSTNNRPREAARTLNDLSWLDRRRSVGVVGDLDYALTHLAQTSPRSASPPPSSRPPTVAMSNRPFVHTPVMALIPEPLSKRHFIVHSLFHVLLLANCVLALIMLFSKAPIVSFILFLIWTVLFYVCLFYLAWNGRPRYSILTIVFHRLRGQPPSSIEPSPDETPMDDRAEPQLFRNSGSGNSPYVYHQPLWRRAVSPEDDHLTRTSHGRPTVETDVDDDDDEDEDSRQRRMEEELERRDVHIVTVPRKRLWIANPS